jgi:hypothetical protein
VAKYKKEHKLWKISISEFFLEQTRLQDTERKMLWSQLHFFGGLLHKSQLQVGFKPCLCNFWTLVTPWWPFQSAGYPFVTNVDWNVTWIRGPMDLMTHSQRYSGPHVIRYPCLKTSPFYGTKYLSRQYWWRYLRKRACAYSPDSWILWVPRSIDKVLSV